MTGVWGGAVSSNAGVRTSRERMDLYVYERSWARGIERQKRKKRKETGIMCDQAQQ